MLFNSYIFLLMFLPLCLCLYFFCTHRAWYKPALAVIIAMSLWFYAYDHVQYLIILIFSILFNWFCSKLVRNEAFRFRKIVLAVGVLVNVAVIFYFKYFNFFIDNVNRAAGLDLHVEKILLPLGISFYTFQQVSYLVDSWRGETAGYTFLEYAAFVSFFPQLVAGPIVLHDEIIPQFRDENKRRFQFESFSRGLYILAAGLFKKVLIADTFGRAVSWGWGRIDQLSSMEILLVMLSYTFQIYFDFSGYSDMAIGIGAMFNIDIPANFDSPYKSYSITEFWKRWHLTLTRFLRRYVYFPLGGSKKGPLRTYCNIMIVYLVSGIWHGASWTFILWGIIHGIANVLNRVFQKSWNKCNQVFQWFCTFIFINVTWLIFRAESVGQAFDLVKRLLRFNTFEVDIELIHCFQFLEFEGFKLTHMIRSIVPGFFMWLYLFGGLFVCLNMKNSREAEFRPTIGKMILTVVMLFWTVISLGGISTFLYFNF